MRYFIEGKKVMSSGRYITFREVPTYGELYLQPFTGRCISRLTYGFGYKLPKFKAADFEETTFANFSFFKAKDVKMAKS